MSAEVVPHVPTAAARELPPADAPDLPPADAPDLPTTAAPDLPPAAAPEPSPTDAAATLIAPRPPMPATIDQAVADAVEFAGESAREFTRDNHTTASETSPRRNLLRATAISGGFNILGSLLGLLRDLLLAAFFGATGTTDAFLVSWTIPETASPLLIEDAMAFLMVPAFSRAVHAEQDGDAGAVRRLAGATFPPLVLALSVVSLLGLVSAPEIVHLLAPGLSRTALAVSCTRITSATVLAMGMTGYVAAALRSHQVFGPPAAIYVAFNSGLILCVLAFRGIGVTAAAVGVVAGAFLMLLVQARPYLRRVGLSLKRDATSRNLAYAAVAPIGLFTLSRQAQVFIERYLGSRAATGTISHLNYAQKIAQAPMSIAMTVSVVSFPAMAQALAAGRRAEAGRRLADDLRLTGLAILAGTAVLVGCAPQIVGILFQHGRFTAADTAATASVIRVYSLGLLGQVLVGVTVRVYFAQAAVVSEGPRRVHVSRWFPARAMGIGLLLTGIVGAYAAPRWGGPGIAAANALGITSTALMLLSRVGRKATAFPLRRFTAEICALAVLAAFAGAGAWAVGSIPGLPALAGVAAGVAVVGVILVAPAYYADRARRARRFA